MLLHFPNLVKKLWYAWNLQSCILLSLWLQAILVLFAFLRKQTKRKLLHGLIWFAYFLANWIAPVAIGLISKIESVNCDGKGNNKDLMAFWASFLLCILVALIPSLRLLLRIMSSGLGTWLDSYYRFWQLLISSINRFLTSFVFPLSWCFVWELSTM